jgi:hypothetical protein
MRPLQPSAHPSWQNMQLERNLSLGMRTLKHHHILDDFKIISVDHLHFEYAMSSSVEICFQKKNAI